MDTDYDMQPKELEFYNKSIRTRQDLGYEDIRAIQSFKIKHYPCSTSLVVISSNTESALWDKEVTPTLKHCSEYAYTLSRRFNCSITMYDIATMFLRSKTPVVMDNQEYYLFSRESVHNADFEKYSPGNTDVEITIYLNTLVVMPYYRHLLVPLDFVFGKFVKGQIVLCPKGSGKSTVHKKSLDTFRVWEDEYIMKSLYPISDQFLKEKRVRDEWRNHVKFDTIKIINIIAKLGGLVLCSASNMNYMMADRQVKRFPHIYVLPSVIHRHAGEMEVDYLLKKKNDIKLLKELSDRNKMPLIEVDSLPSYVKNLAKTDLEQTLRWHEFGHYTTSERVSLSWRSKTDFEEQEISIITHDDPIFMDLNKISALVNIVNLNNEGTRRITELDMGFIKSLNLKYSKCTNFGKLLVLNEDFQDHPSAVSVEDEIVYDWTLLYDTVKSKMVNKSVEATDLKNKITQYTAMVLYWLVTEGGIVVLTKQRYEMLVEIDNSIKLLFVIHSGPSVEEAINLVSQNKFRRNKCSLFNDDIEYSDDKSSDYETTPVKMMKQYLYNLNGLPGTPVDLKFSEMEMEHPHFNTILSNKSETGCLYVCNRNKNFSDFMQKMASKDIHLINWVTVVDSIVEEYDSSYINSPRFWISSDGKFVAKMIYWLCRINSIVLVPVDIYNIMFESFSSFKILKNFNVRYICLQDESYLSTAEKDALSVSNSLMDKYEKQSNFVAKFPTILDVEKYFMQIQFSPVTRKWGDTFHFSTGVVPSINKAENIFWKRFLIWFRSRSFSFWRNDPPKPVLENYDELYMIAQAILIDLHLRVHYRDVNIVNRYMDFSVINIVTNKIYTPDFVYRDIDGHSIYLEYKCKEGNPTIEDHERVEIDLANRIGTDRKYCKAEIVSLNPRNNAWLKRNKEDMDGYSTLHSVLMKLRSQLPEDRLIQLAENFGASLSDLWIKRGSDYWRTVVEENITQPVPDLSNKYRPLEEYAREFVSYIPNFENYLESNILWTEDTMDHYREIDIMEANVFLEHPFNWKKNKEKYIKLHNLSQGEDLFVGNKASKLLHFPVMLEHYDTDPVEVLKFLNDFDEIKDDMVLDIIDLWEKNILVSEEREEIRTINFTTSYFKGESKASELRSFLQKTGEFKITVEDEKTGISRLETDIEMIKRLSSEKRHFQAQKAAEKTGTNVFLTKHGAMMFKGRNKLSNAMKSKYSKYSKEAEEIQMKKIGNPVRMESGDYMKAVEKSINSMKCVKSKFELSDFKDAYLCSETKNKISNDLVSKATDLIKKNVSSTLFLITENWNHSLNTFMMNVPRIMTKSMSGTELVLFQEPHTKAYVISGPRPNKITSSPIIIYGMIKYTDIGIELADKRKEKIRDWYGNINYFRNGDMVFYYTKPFRYNFEAAQQSQSFVFGGLSAAVLSESLNQSLSNDIMFWSLFWNFSLNVEWFLDVLYLVEKSSYLSNTFGKAEIQKFLGEQTITDVRVATGMHRLKMNHKVYSQTAYRSTSTAALGQMQNIKHPIFDINISGWQGSMVITYLKNLYPKMSGHDLTKKMMKFFGMDGESGFEEEYLRSPMNNGNKTLFDDLSIEDFYNNYVFKDEEKSKMWNYSYHNGVIYKTIKILTDAAVDENKRTIIDFEKDAAAANTVAASRIMVPTSQMEYLGIKVKDNKLNQNYHGLIGQDLVDAMLSEQEMFKRMLEEEGKNGTKHRFKVDITDLVNKSAVFNSFSSDRLWSNMEMTCVASLLYPNVYICCFVIKAQVGSGKRAFFVQTLFSRNLNKMVDWVARAPLATRKNPSDILTKKGLEKNLIMQENFKSLKPELGTMKVIMDMSKLGDRSLPRGMSIFIYAAYDSGLISLEERNLFLYAMVCLQKRVELMPYEVARALDKINKRIERKERIREIDRKHIKTISEGVMGELLRSKDADHIMGSNFFWDEVTKNRYITRLSGAILGGFNVVWSLYSSAYIMFIDQVSILLFGTKTTIAETHSDDCELDSKLPAFDKSDYSQFVFHKVIKLWEDYENLNGKLTWRDGFIVVQYTENNILKEYYSTYPATWLSKVMMSVIIMSPKLVNQSPGGKKVGNGCVKEILQQIMNNAGEIFTPLVRFCNVASESPGRSVYGDQSAAFSLCYNSLLHSCPAVYYTSQVMIATAFVTKKYGLKAKDRGINDLSTDLGIIYALPDDILMYGTDADEGRKLANSMVSGQEVLKKKIMLSFNTPFIYNRTKITTEERLEQNFDLETMTKMIEEDPDQRKLISSTTYKVIEFIYDRTMLTARGKNMKLKIFKSVLNTAAGFKEYDDAEHSYNTYKELLGPLLMTSSKSFGHKIVSEINKHEKPGSLQIKSSPDSILVAQKGTRKRQFPNIFSSYALSHLSEKYRTDRIMYIDIKEGKEELANSNFEIPLIHKKAYEERCRLFGHIITYMTSFKAETVEVQRKINYNDMGRSYEKLEPMTTNTYKLQYIIFSLYDIWWQKKNPNLLRFKNPLYIWEPSLRKNEEFEKCVEAIKTRLAYLEIKTVDEIRLHARLVANMYQNREFSGIVQLPKDDLTPIGYLRLNYTFETVLEFKNLVRIVVTADNYFMPDTVMSDKNLERALLLTLWKCGMMHIELKPSKIISVGQIIKFNAEIEFEKRVRSSNFSIEDASSLLTLCLWSASQGTVLTTYRKKSKKENKIEIFWDFGVWPTLLLIGEERESVDDRIGSIKVYKKYSWSVFYTMKQKFIMPCSLELLLMSLCSFVSISFGSRKNGISSIKDFKLLDKALQLQSDYHTFQVYDNKLQIRGSSTSSNLPTVALIRKDSLVDEEALLAKFKGDNVGYGLSFGERKPYIVTPWYISEKPTGLITYKQVVDSNDIEIIEDTNKKVTDQGFDRLLYITSNNATYKGVVEELEYVYLEMEDVKNLLKIPFIKELCDYELPKDESSTIKLSMKLSRYYCLDLRLFYEFILGLYRHYRIKGDLGNLVLNSTEFSLFKADKLYVKASEQVKVYSVSSRLTNQQRRLLLCLNINKIMRDSLVNPTEYSSFSLAPSLGNVKLYMINKDAMTAEQLKTAYFSEMALQFLSPAVDYSSNDKGTLFIWTSQNNDKDFLKYLSGLSNFVPGLKFETEAIKYNIATKPVKLPYTSFMENTTLTGDWLEITEFIKEGKDIGYLPISNWSKLSILKVGNLKYEIFLMLLKVDSTLAKYHSIFKATNINITHKFDYTLDDNEYYKYRIDGIHITVLESILLGIKRDTNNEAYKYAKSLCDNLSTFW